MSIFAFCAGLGVGAFLALIFVIIAVGRVNKQNDSYAKKRDKETAELLRERNRLDAIKCDLLKEIKEKL